MREKIGGTMTDTCNVEMKKGKLLDEKGNPLVHGGCAAHELSGNGNFIYIIDDTKDTFHAYS